MIKILITLLLTFIIHSNISAQSRGGIYSSFEAYYRRIDNKGISKETDWKWLCSLLNFDPYIPKDPYTMKLFIEDLKKDSIKQFLTIIPGQTPYGTSDVIFSYKMEVRGTLRLNDKKDTIMVNNISSLKITRKSVTYGSEDYNVEKIIIDISGPVTKETITEEFLKPIRDIRQTITEDLKLVIR